MSKAFFISTAVFILVIVCLFLPACEPATSAPVVSNPEANNNTTQVPSTDGEVTPAVSSIISVDELAQKFERGDSFVLVDVRDREDFDKGHITGAVSIPFEELPNRFLEIPKGPEVIIYAECA